MVKCESSIVNAEIARHPVYGLTNRLDGRSGAMLGLSAISYISAAEHAQSKSRPIHFGSLFPGSVKIIPSVQLTSNGFFKLGADRRCLGFTCGLSQVQGVRSFRLGFIFVWNCEREPRLRLRARDGSTCAEKANEEKWYQTPHASVPLIKYYFWMKPALFMHETKIADCISFLLYSPIPLPQSC